MSELAAAQMTLAERATLDSLEVVIERGLATFTEVGNALLAIRDGRLYRELNDTFEDYCQQRWGMSRQRANQLVAAAAVTTMVVIPPENERQARELAPLLDEPQQLQEAWAEVRALHPKPTAADVREVVSRRMDVHYSSARDDWSTPQDLFDTLDQEFVFITDVCATDESAKCALWYTKEDDGLAQHWVGTCWMNPPYGDEIVHWIRKAHESADAGATVVCLVPARVDTGWWWDHCRHGEIRFLRGRLKFGGGDTAAPFPSAVVVFGRPARVVWWER